MTLQQLTYVIELNRYRNFAVAAEACGITQPTLSAMLAKLEDELDVRIFDRSNKKVTPTTTGAKIIVQAERAVREASRISEIVAEEKGSVSGPLRLTASPSIAPYILPEFIRQYLKSYPQVSLTVEEMRTENMLNEIANGKLDAGITISGNVRDGIFEIPLYTEKFLVYLSEDCKRDQNEFRPEDLEHENMWIVKEAQCLRESAFSFCKARAKGKQIYEAGNIDTLIRIVDRNGGYTIIPEMHVALLNERQRKNVRRIEGDHLSERRVSLYIKDDCIRQNMLNTITDTLRRFMPEGMLNRRIAQYGIKL